MSKNDLRELNIFKTVYRKGKRYAVNGAPFQTLDTLAAFLFKQRNITVSVEVLRELLDELATDEVVHEKEIQQRMQKMFGGEREVHTPVGFIDLLTDTQLFESKRATQWKHAVGQLLSYSKFFPDRELVLYVFGDLPKNIGECYELCKLHKIKLMYEMS